MHKIGVRHGARVKCMRANGGPSRGLVAGHVIFSAFFADSWAEKIPFNFRKHTRPVGPPIRARREIM